MKKDIENCNLTLAWRALFRWWFLDIIHISSQFPSIRPRPFDPCKDFTQITIEYVE